MLIFNNSSLSPPNYKKYNFGKNLTFLPILYNLKKTIFPKLGIRSKPSISRTIIKIIYICITQTSSLA